MSTCYGQPFPSAVRLDSGPYIQDLVCTARRGAARLPAGSKVRNGFPVDRAGLEGRSLRRRSSSMPKACPRH